jgi:hypothetical protein
MPPDADKTADLTPAAGCLRVVEKAVCRDSATAEDKALTRGRTSSVA